jgi:uncharacterized phosphosugar-binding protein
MNKALQYIENIENIMKDIKENQLEVIGAVAGKFAETLMNNGRIHAFGTGHSHMFALELFYRAGGLVNINPMLEESLMLHSSAVKSTSMERLEGYGQILFDHYGLRSGDLLVIASNSGRNSVSIDLAAIAKANGVSVIVLTSMEHTLSSSSRHSGGKRLYEFGDLVLDNRGCKGDASIEIDGFGRKVSPTSTVIGTMLLNAIAAQAVQIMIDRGYEPEVFSSSNIDGGDQVNSKYIEKYKGVIKAL